MRFTAAIAGILMLAGCAVLAGVAGAVGMPVLGIDGNPARVSTLDRLHTYLAQPGRRDTVVTESGTSSRSARLHGRFVVPVVALDGSASGLAADGRTLVLIRPRVTFPEPETKLAVLDARTLRPRTFVSLHGDFSFDAISPDGHWIYLIQYTSGDPTQYRVRAFDLQAGRLLTHDIIDPRDREQMHGSPLTRTPSPDGRWAYTLYQGQAGPFIHALDTSGLTARCIDLPSGLDFSTARIWLDGSRLLLVSGGRELAAIDLNALVPHRSASGGPLSIVLLAVAVAALAGAALAVRRRGLATVAPGA